MKKKTVMCVLVLLGIIALITGCSGRSALVGVWEIYDDGEIMEFLSDGTYIEDGDKGEWKVENGRLLITMYGRVWVHADYTVSGSTLTLVDVNSGEVYQCIKLKK